MRLSVCTLLVSPGAQDVRDLSFCAGGRELRPTLLEAQRAAVLSRNGSDGEALSSL